MSVYRVYGTTHAQTESKDWHLLLETNDPVEATKVLHETDGTFWRRLTEDGQVVIGQC